MSSGNHISNVPVTYSTISAVYLKEWVEQHYSIGLIQKIQFLKRSLNDSYLIYTNSKKYILRVYRKWRTVNDVGYEVDWLKFLNQCQSPTMQVLSQKEGNLFSTIQAPEGIRCVALFPWLDDINHLPINQKTAFLAGQSLAKIHVDSKIFESKYIRKLDAQHLVDEPLKGIYDWYPESSARTKISQLSLMVKEKLSGLKTEIGAYGPCHGDTYFGNLMFKKQQKPFWLDFDCCGLGWRSYDLATFYWALKIKWAGWGIQYAASDEEVWKSFIEGYQSIRTLGKEEWESMPYFVIARGIWALGLHPNNIDDWTTEGVEDNGQFFNSHLDLFARLKEDFPSF